MIEDYNIVNTPQTTPNPIILTPPQILTPRDEVPETPRFRMFKYQNKIKSKRRRTYYSMILSSGIFALSTYILCFRDDKDLQLLAVSLISSVSSVWLSNLKFSSKSNSDSDSN